MLDAVVPARNRAIDVLRSAWQFATDDPFHPGRPIVPEYRLPHGVARLEAVPRGQSGVRSVSEAMVFELGGYFSLPEGADAEALKVEKAKAAGEALLNANWADVGCYMPEVRNVEFIEEETPRPYYLVLVTFAVTSDVFQ